MREKELKLLITFRSTTGAIAMETYCKAHSIPGRLIPVPEAITAGCGMAWCTPPNSRQQMEAAISFAGLQAEGWYELLI